MEMFFFVREENIEIFEMLSSFKFVPFEEYSKYSLFVWGKNFSKKVNRQGSFLLPTPSTSEELYPCYGSKINYTPI